MGRISGIDWDLEHVEPEPMGHEWGEPGALDDAYDLPFESAVVPESEVSPQPAPVAIVTDDFGGGSHEVDPASMFDEEAPIEEGSIGNAHVDLDVGTDQPLYDPETEHQYSDMAEIDPFDTFDEEFSQVIEELEAELPAVEEMVDG